MTLESLFYSHIQVQHTVFTLSTCIHTCIHIIKCYICVYIIWTTHTANCFASPDFVLMNLSGKYFHPLSISALCLWMVTIDWWPPEAASGSAVASLWDILLGTGILIYMNAFMMESGHQITGYMGCLEKTSLVTCVLGSMEESLVRVGGSFHSL